MTFQDLRYDGVVAQTTEYSCGAAAVASLLAEYFGVAATEEEVLRAAEAQVLARGEEPGFAVGLTAYDLVSASAGFGLRLLGYELDQGQLEDYFARGGLPVISHVTKPRSHFLVVVGVVEENVLICDPGCGRFVVPMGELVDGRGMSQVFLVAVPNEEQALHVRETQASALQWMICRVAQLSELRESAYP